MVSSLNILTTYAFLKEKAEGNSDYVDLFLPIIRHCLSKCQRDQPIFREDLQKALEEEFGIMIPLHCWELFINRFKRSEEILQKDKMYFLTESFSPLILTTEIENHNNEIQLIANLILEFATIDDPDWTLEKVFHAIYEFCSIFGIKIYLKDVFPAENSRYSKEFKMVSRYVQTIKETDPINFEKFLKIVNGYILSNILTFSNSTSMQNAFPNVKIYLDTKVVLNAISLGSPEETRATQEMLSLLRSKCNNLYIFDHTRQETLKIVNQCITEWETPSFDRIPALINAKINNMKYTDLVQVAGEFDKYLLKNGIIAERTPIQRKVNPKEHDFLNRLKEYGGYSQVGEGAAYNDVKTYFDVMKIRDNVDFDEINNCQAIMVTTNPRFAKNAAEFSIHEFHQTGISPVITDISAAVIAWLNSPLDIDLPKNLILSLSMAALMPTSEFWNRFINLLEEASSKGEVDEQTVNIFKISPHVKRELAGFTQGREIELSTEILPKLANLLRDEIISDARKEFEAEKEITGSNLRHAMEQKESYAMSLFLSEQSRTETENRAIKAEAAAAVAKVKSRTQGNRKLRARIKWILLVSCGTTIFYEFYRKMFSEKTQHPYIHYVLISLSFIFGIYFIWGRFYKKYSVDWLISMIIPKPRMKFN